jgi:hypothetical protein
MPPNMNAVTHSQTIGCEGLSATEVHAIAVGELGLDPDLLDLEAPETLAALVRRAASLAAPCSPRVLREAAIRSLTGLVDSEREKSRTILDSTIESLVAYGDLLELPAEEGTTLRTLYLAPPTFVSLEGVLFLIGGELDGADALPSDLREQVEYRSHTRRLRVTDEADTSTRLREIGWVDLPRDLWLAPPRRESPEETLARANGALRSAATHGDVPGLIVLDPATAPTYYRGRWASPDHRSKRFVARREQRYGADLWSYVELTDGAVTRLTDLPLEFRHSTIRACDDAWRLQMAIDALAGNPQRFRVRPASPRGTVIIDFFSPIPLWARRRWDVLGEEVAPSGSLFAYRFPEAEFLNARQSFETDLWLAER